MAVNRCPRTHGARKARPDSALLALAAAWLAVAWSAPAALAAARSLPIGLSDGVWTLVAGQDASGGSAWPTKRGTAAPALEAAPHDEASNMFSRLAGLETLRDAQSCAFTFAIAYPDLSGEDNFNEWVQSSNPLTSLSVTGFIATQLHLDAANFGGIARATNPGALLAAMGGTGFAVGVTTPGTFPGPTVAGGASTTRVELWAKVPSGNVAAFVERSKGIGVTAVNPAALEVVWQEPAAAASASPAVEGYSLWATPLDFRPDFSTPLQTCGAVDPGFVVLAPSQTDDEAIDRSTAGRLRLSAPASSAFSGGSTSRGSAPVVLALASPPPDSDFIVEAVLDGTGSSSSVSGGIVLYDDATALPIVTFSLSISSGSYTIRAVGASTLGSGSLPAGETAAALRIERDGNAGSWRFSWRTGTEDVDNASWRALASAFDPQLSTTGSVSSVGVYAAADTANPATIDVTSFALTFQGCAAERTYSFGPDSSGELTVLDGLADGVPYEVHVAAIQSGSSWPVASTLVGAAPHISAGLPVTDNLQLHLSVAGHDPTSSLYAWPDLSGNGRSPVQTTSSRQPRVVADAAGEHPTVRFDGSDVLSTPDSVDLDPGSEDFTVFFMFRPNSVRRAQYPLAKGNLRWAMGWSFLSYGSGPIGFRVTDTSSRRAGVATSSFTDVEFPHVWSWELYHSSTIAYQRGWVDNDDEGWFVHNDVITRNPTRTSNPLTVGAADTSGSSSFIGDLYEVLIYRRRLSAAEHLSVYNYITDKYSLRCDDLAPDNTVEKPGTHCTGATTGDVCELYCEDGYDIASGDGAPRQCLFGSWTGEPLICTPKCPLMRAPDNFHSCKERVVADAFTSADSLNAWTTAPVLPPRSPQWSVDPAENVLSSPAVADPCSVALSMVQLNTVWWSQRKAYTVSVQYQADETLARAGVVFRMVEPDTYYSLELDPATGVHSLRKTLAGVTNEIQAGGCPFTAAIEPGAWYSVDIEVGFDTAGWGIRVTFDGAVVCTVEDHDIPFGSIGLYARGVARFSDLVVDLSCSPDNVCHGYAGSTCRFECLRGYVLYGSAERTCDSSGAWAGSPANCTLTPPEFGEAVHEVSENANVNDPVGPPLNVSIPADDATLTFHIVDDGGNVDDVFRVGLCDGQLSVRYAGILDFETRPVYILTIVATLDNNPDAATTRDIRVIVIDANDPPVIHSEPMSVPENSLAGTPIGPPLNVTDNDTPRSNLTFSIYDYTNADGAFAVDAEGQLRVGFDYALDFETKSEYTLLIEVADVNDPELFDSGRFHISIIDSNDPPFVQTGQQLVIDEFTAAVAGADFDFQVAADDQDAGDATHLSFSFVSELSVVGTSGLIGDLSPAYFAVNATSGEVTTSRPVIYDRAYSTNPPIFYNGFMVRGSWEIDVEVADGRGGSAAGTVSVLLVANTTTIPASSGIIKAMEVQDGELSALDIRGGEVVIFRGDNFGSVGQYDVYATYSRGGATDTVFVADSCAVMPSSGGTIEYPGTYIQCETVAGWGAELQWTVRLDDSPLATTEPLVVAYTPPTITGTTVLDDSGSGLLSTLGGTKVALVGSSLASLSTTPVIVRFGSAPGFAQGTAVVASKAVDSIVVVMPAGVGNDIAFAVSVDNQVAVTPDFARVAYTPPKVTALYTVSTGSGAPPLASELRTTGGDFVVLLGSGFGPGDVVPTATYSPELAGATVDFMAVDCTKPDSSSPDTQIQCTTVPGVGKDHSWTVIVGGQASEPSRARTGYERPSVRAVTGPGAVGGSTSGGQTVIINGGGFGPVGLSVPITATYGDVASGAADYTAVDCAVTVADAQLTCKTAPGTGMDHSWVVVIAEQSSRTFHAQTSYARPVVGSIARLDAGSSEADDLKTEGAEPVAIFGRNFGFDSGKIDSVTYGPSGTEYSALGCSISTAHTKIVCFTAPGAGVDHTWLVTVDGQVSTNPLTSYAPPVISALSPGWNLQPAGGQVIRILGENLGTDADLGEVTYGPSGTEFVAQSCHLATPHTEIECRTAPGGGAGHKWQLVVGSQRNELLGQLPVLSSYGSPVIETVEPFTDSGDGVSCCATEGGYRMRVTGNNLAPPDMITAVLRSPLGIESVLAIADFDAGSQSFTVQIPPGQGTGHVFQLRQGVGSLSFLSTSNVVSFDYDPPVATRLVVETLPANDTTPAVLSYFGTDASLLSEVFLYGRNFGLATYSALAATTGTVEANFVLVDGSTDVLAALPADGAPGVTRCFILEYSHTFLRCATTLTTGRVWVSVDGRVSNAKVFFFLSPVLGLLGHDPLSPTTSSTEGGKTMTIYGSHMGLSKDDLNVTVGEWRCPITVFTPIESDDGTQPGKILCTIPPGQGAPVDVVVYRRGMAGNPMEFRYDEPELTLISPAVVNTDGTTSVTLTGRNFGLTPFVVFGSVSVAATYSLDAVGHTTINAVAPASAVGGTGISVLVHVGNQVSRQDIAYAYAKPTVDAGGGTTGLAGDTRGGATFTLSGANFALGGTVRVGEYEADCGQLWQHDRITCTAPAGQGRNQRVTVIVGGQQSEEDIGFDYTPPVVTDISVAAAPSAGMQLNMETVTSVVSALQVERARQPDLTSRQRAERSVVESIELRDAFEAATQEATSLFVVVRGDFFGVDPPAVIFRRGSLVTYPGLGSVLLYNQTHATFELPPGYGRGWSVQVAAPAPPSALAAAAGEPSPGPSADAHVQTSSVGTVEFHYDPPQILISQPPMTPTDACEDTDEFGECIRPATVTLWGISLGNTPIAALPTAPGRRRELQSAAPAEMAILWDGVALPGSVIYDNSHFKVSFYVPKGIGTDHTIQLAIGRSAAGDTAAAFEMVSDPVIFHYLPPRVTGVEQRPFNASSEEITIYGENFGPDHSDVSVFVGGLACADATWRKDVTSGGQPYISCIMSRDTVGYKNATVYVADQSVFVEGEGARLPAFYAACLAGEYGQTGEYCSPCNTGAECDGGLQNVKSDGTQALCSPETCPVLYVEPRASPGWWAVQVDTQLTPEEAELRCHPTKLGRATCPAFLPCEPGHACVGGNACQVGYEGNKLLCETSRNNQDNTCTVDADCNGGDASRCTSLTPQYCASCELVPSIVNGTQVHVGRCMCQPAERCSLCTSGTHFRDNGECVTCPDNVWLLILFFALGAITACGVGYVLNSKSVNMAFLSIGVDYFQILAIFRRSKVAWPPELLEMFRIFSLFNFNLDITAPECAIPDLEYSTKWTLIQAIPLAVGSIFLLVHLVKLTYKLCIRASSSRRNRHVPTLVSTGLVIFYYLYLYLLRTQLEVFNCLPTDPPDGHTYAEFTSPACGGLCRCDEDGGMQQEILPLAAVAFCVYTLGFPGTVGYMLWKNRGDVIADQVMRAHRLPTTRAALGPEIYSLRKKLHKVYYQYVALLNPTFHACD